MKIEESPRTMRAPLAAPPRTADLAGDGTRPGSRRSAPLTASGAVLMAALVTTIAVLAARGERVVVGLPDAGAMTEYAWRAARGSAELTAAGTVGVLLALAVLVPRAVVDSHPSEVERLARVVRWWSIAWALASMALLVLTCAQAVHIGARRLLTSGAFLDVLPTVPEARALVPTVVVACLTAAWASAATSRAVVWPLLALAMAALLPPLFTSHVGHSQSVDAASFGMMAHVPAAALWVGGLMALVLHLRGSHELLLAAVPRFSQLAGACFAAVVGSGLVAAYVRLEEIGNLWDSHYGRLLLTKAVVLICLGACGALHRRRALPAIAAGRPRAFLRLAAGELLLMATAFGLAAALATSAPPA